ncbi:methyl-accepting chemotaxis protein [Aneurinibacillus soli]|uniref:Methyl-accepting chemotaxis protein McpA n=1 Tax=Aneurinibacillus soli TaxID=1500254 RepID=A0A0U5B1L1_9BACL|nr:methyl-accepting chemotaxis protein [Aneurinibacillus soli]BAU29889.1 Methyl-accepting chemotaxis protein McpA [Aneurinibacillus soli]
MKLKKNLSIKWKMILTLTISVLLPTLLLGVISYQTAEKKVEEQILQSARNNIVFLDQMITKYIEEEIRSLDLLSDLLQSRMAAGSNQAQVKETLIRFLTSRAELTNVSVLSASQVLYTASTPSAESQPINADLYRKAVENSGQVILGEPYLDAKSKDMRVSFIRTLPDSTIAIAATMSLKDLGTQISHVKIGNGGYPYLLDVSRHYLVHPTGKLGTQTNTKQSIQMYSKPSGEFDYEFEGKQKKLFFTTNKTTGWKLAGTMYVNEPQIAARPILTAMLWVMVITFAIVGIQNFFVLRSLIGRLRTFIQAARRVSEGDLSQTVRIRVHDELGELATEFNKMSEKLRSMVHHVKEKSEQLSASSEELTASAEQTEKASGQIATIIQGVACGSEKQAQNVDDTSATMETMAVQIHDITEQANTLSHIAEEASEKANYGNHTIQKTIEQMNTLHQTVLQMGGRWIT